ncbi:carboxypeptidase-like regulatory domain-containing protein [Polaribacter porphyrae]|uniref:TonB-dependent receptor n=1 Tax=Polaribacter porphyrae TaxID=1137780 RepID=A0A2S7WT25_9FLAO|nr:carboxypeptidase-like regulatory domain-containing protein [Polaribacter porphyrae]PQJ80606.1 hypothetical protein BTO18_16115 [Polaribacter porphyrae]
MVFKKLTVFCFIFFTAILVAQKNTIIISGRVLDSLAQPIVKATLIAKSKQANVKTNYSITDVNGYYKLKLQKGVTYQLSISHLSYKTLQKEVTFLENDAHYSVVLKIKAESLDEVIINYKYKPIEKKKDTITYNLKAFTNGNEFKMKDVLEKLPGVKVENSTVKVQGKTVTKLLVEGKPFFDGSTKLAIENIPADVMDKIEIISNYKESELLRNLADNEDLALNVVLKEDKKNFMFGDIETGSGVALDEFYKLHPALFKYNPKSNFSFIADVNNFNDNSLSFSDLSRLVGNTSNLLRQGSSANSLLSLATGNEERFQSLTRFSAFNFQKEISDKFTISGYAVYSNNDIQNKANSLREYIVDDTSIEENREDFSNTANKSSMFTIKLDYDPSSNQKWLYNANYLTNSSLFDKESISTLEDANQFLTDTNGDNYNFSHNLEGYFRVSKKHTMGIAFYQNVIKSNSIDSWSSNNIFLDNFLPLQNTSSYQILQNNSIDAQQVSFLAKDYWLASRYFHLFYDVRYSKKNSTIRTNISQALPDETIVKFINFDNNNILKLSDVNFGIGIKSLIGKLEFTLEGRPHFYNFSRVQLDNATFFIEPKLTLSYKIDDDIELDFDYNYSNNFLNDLDYLENLKILSFNAVLQGNPNLVDERSHNFGIFYSNYKNVDDYFFSSSLDFSINNPVRNNGVFQDGINQLNAPVLLSLAEQSLSSFNEFGLVFNKSSLDFTFSFDWFKTNQVINNNVTQINSYEYYLKTKWLYKLSKASQLNLQYKYSGYDVVAEGDNNSSEHTFSLNFDTKLFKNVIFRTDFSTNFVTNFDEGTQNYTIQNLFLGYSKPNSPISYNINFKNIYNNGVIVRNTFGNNLFISNQVFTLPRVFLFELNYKF